jgi:putative CocE/NonD family hydrolase
MHLFRYSLPILAFSLTASAAITVDTVLVSMRDGIKLATDVYRDESLPAGPVVLMRTPYNKAKAKGTAEKIVEAGYVAVIQDCRGTHGSEGILIPYNNEGQDGYDSIEWVTRQTWCNGRIGMTGGSYVGAVQWQAAVEHPPGLVAIAPQATWSSFYRNLYLGGAVRLALIAGWAAGNSARPADAKPVDWDATLLHLPLSEIDEKIGWPIPWLKGALTHPELNGYWTRLELKGQLPSLSLPALHVVGYYDFFSRESVDSFTLIQKADRTQKGSPTHRLILGPWDHGTIGKSRVAEVDFGAEAALDTFALQRDWFDRHLKMDPEAQAKPFPPVRYFSMGDNVWRDAQTWPPQGFTDTSFYLRSSGKANTAKGAGRLLREAPSQHEPADTFLADPANPAPASAVTDKRPLRSAVWGPTDQRPIEEREDVLVYTGDTLTSPLTFAGNVSAKLHVSSSTVDADWAVKLVDVHPDGYAQNLASGILRGRFRESITNPKPLQPGKVYEITVDLGPVAATLLEGHRLRVDVCGALFPLYDRNPNTGEGPFGSGAAIATETVLHQPDALSRVILPCLKK